MDNRPLPPIPLPQKARLFPRKEDNTTKLGAAKDREILNQHTDRKDTKKNF
jgi:hypothetical protein